MRRDRCHRGFSLIEVMCAMMLFGVAATGLLVAFVASGQFGVLSRRQATAMAVARTISGQLSRVAYNDARLNNVNAGNDASIGDPNGLFARAALPTGNDAPDSTLPVQTVGTENYEVYVNVALQMGDGVWDLTTLEMGRLYAVIVRYRVGQAWMRAVAVGYHYNPAAVGTGTIPLPL